MRKKKKVTMQDIANKLGISKVTVSKALNEKDGVGSELKEKIIATSREMGYIPPNSGKTEESSKNIAILLNEKFADGEANFYLRCYQRLSFELSKLGYFTNLFTVNQIMKDRVELTAQFSQNHICGVILLGTFKKAFVENIKSLDIPCTLMDMYDSDSEMDCVVTENIYSTYELTNHLLECGHRDIGFVGTIYSTGSIQDRFLGYFRALLENRIEINPDWILDDRDDENQEVKIILPENMPTAFVCNCDDTAYYFIKILNENGYSVPKDISIVSFDNDIYAELCEPKLTTVAVDIELMAVRAAKLIVEKVEKPNAIKHGVVFVNGRIIYRDSVKRIN